MTTLHAVPTGEIDPDAPTYRVLAKQLEEADDQLRGYEATIASQAGMIGRLKSKLEASDPEAHPRHTEMAALLDRWRTKTRHPKARASKDRFDLIRARLNDGYEIDDLELAVDGLGAFPYRSFDKRLATGEPSQRDDQLSVALKSGESVEKFCNLGHQARKEAT